MLVMRTLHNTELEIRERMAVEALAKGFATENHYNTILDMQGILILAGCTEKHRRYAREYAENVIGPVLISIKERYSRTGKLGCAGGELKILKEFIKFYKSFWVRQPTELYITACEELQKFYDSLKEKKSA